MTVKQGRPVWFELTTSKGDLAAAGEFYRNLLGWQIEEAGVEGMAYHLASCDGDKVAGLIEIEPFMGDIPPNWLIYFAVDSVDKTAAAITAAEGKILHGPGEVPGTGRYAIVSDPQGAVYGILQMEPMEDGETGSAFDQAKAGHGNWTELMSSDPDAGFGFYSALFGWKKSATVDMGDMGTYQLFSHDGADIGGMMGLGFAPAPAWLPYFGVNGVAPAIARITENGGTLVHGPQEVPGGAFIAIGRDPQGGHFAVVGPKETSR